MIGQKVFISQFDSIQFDSIFIRFDSIQFDLIQEDLIRFDSITFNYTDGLNEFQCLIISMVAAHS